MTLNDVFMLCTDAGKKYGLDPVLLLAICEQESSFLSDAVRLENGFYRRYARPLGYSPAVAVLLSSSYGLMQTMGDSLRMLSFFDPSMKASHVAEKIDEYLRTPAVQVDCGARWFLSKLKAASGNIEKALGFWNGDQTGRYASEVLHKKERLITQLAEKGLLTHA